LKAPKATRSTPDGRGTEDRVALNLAKKEALENLRGYQVEVTDSRIRFRERQTDGGGEDGVDGRRLLGLEIESRHVQTRQGRHRLHRNPHLRLELLGETAQE
jgi:hypothetical protein